MAWLAIQLYLWDQVGIRIRIILLTVDAQRLNHVGCWD